MLSTTVANCKKWLSLTFLLFSFCGLAHAVPNIQGKVTHQFTSPSASSSIYSNESVTINWNHTSSTYSASNIQLAYFMLWHRDQNGKGVILRPGKNHQFTVSNLGVGTHEFKVRAVQDYTDGSRKYGSYSSAITVNVNAVKASNLFKAGASTNANHSSSCMPSDMYFRWHKETRQVQSRINGHIVGVSGNSLNADNSISGCTLPDSDVNSTPLKVSEDARQQINLRPANDNMLYVRSHACETDCSETRAEISYDSKKYGNSVYSDGKTHTQEGDIFWVTYRFNPIRLFDSNVKYSIPPHIFLSQFHPETLTTGGTCQAPCDLVRHHSPSFSMILLPSVDANGYSKANKAELKFRTKYWKSASATKVSNFDMGLGKEIDVKSWYQVKIGIKFSTNHSNGWAIAALRKEGDLNWDYFATTANGQGTIFRGKTLHAAPCSLGGKIGGDCNAGQQHYETVFKSGAYYGNLPNDRKGQINKRYELLMDDYFASDNHHEIETWEWPVHLSTSGDYIINDSALSTLPFNSVTIPVSYKSF